MKRVLIILLIICAIAIDINAQTKVYPITVTISGNSNISASLSQLCSPQSTLMFTFQCLDRKENNLPVAVKVRLYPATGKGKSIENQVQMGKKTFDIGFGQTIIEQKTDLEKYFLTNFTNANQSGYYQNGQLVEGSYILQVVCYDARTISRQISNVAKIYLHIDQFNYPTLQFPRNNSDLEEYTTKPTLNFQWLNMGKTDPKIRYKFELWKVINPSSLETYVKQTRPIFVEENLFVTQKSYMPEILNLEIGQKYCWRVTAYDPEKTLSFKRNGESEVFQFQYLNPPVPVTGLKNKILGKQITYTWNTDKSHTKYIVEYYDYKRDTTISAEQTENILKLTAPDYDYRIKFRVKAVCYNDMSRTSDFTPWSEAYVQPENKVEYECGKRFPDREIENQELKTEFFEGEIVESKNGDSRYEIIKAESQGDGSLKGKFYAIMDCWGGAKILCDFWDTKINTDNIVLTTRYKSEDIPGFVADPEEIKKYVNELINNVNMALTDNTIRDTILVNEKFDYLYTENGRLMAVVLDENGNPDKKDVTPERSFTQALITDGQGDTLVVSKKGQVMGVKEYQFAGDNRHLLNEYHRQLDSLGEWQINFNSAKEKQIYAFDQIGSGNHGIFATDEYYPTSGNYDFRYKSVECGKKDKVIVDFGSYPDRDSVIFKDKYGVTLKLSKGNVLNFIGVAKPDTNYIYAYRGDQKIGKLFLNTYQQKTYKVVFVRVNGAAKKLNAKEITKYLNKVYNQCAVSFEDSIVDITIGNLTSFSHGGSGILTVYNDDQKKVLQAYDPQMQDGVYYLFFIDNATDKKDDNGTMVAGYMPRGYNCGFIYDGGSPHTIAHELGHGIAGLEHVFENSSNSGKTKNLMDYSDGEELWHFQWDQIQDPSRVWMKWNKDESEGEWFEAKVITDAIVKTSKINYEGSLTFLTPAGLPITLPSTLSQVSFVSIVDECPDGALTKFNIGKDTYVARYLVNEKDNKTTFMGYIHSSLKDKYYENENFNYRPENVILGYNYECNIELLSMEYSKLSDNFSKITKLGAGEVKLSNISYPRLGLKYLVKISDEEACSLKTDLAKDFYQKEVGKVALTANETNSNSIIHRIAVIIDNALLNNSSAELRLNEFINDVLTKNNYLESKWTVTDYEKLKNYLEYYVNSCTHEESLFLSSSFEGNKFVGIFGFNQSLEQVLSDYSNNSNVEIVCKLLKISCIVGNKNINSVLKNIQKNDYEKFIGIIYAEDDDILTSNIADSRCLFDLVLVKFEEWGIIDNFSNLMWNIVMYKDKSNDNFEVLKQFNDNIPSYAMTSFLDSYGFTLVMSIDARKKLLKYYSEYGLSDEDENVVIRIIKNTPDEDLDALLTYMKDEDLYRTFATKIDNSVLNFGNNNFDKFYNVVYDAWCKCNKESHYDDFIRDTRQAFLSWCARDKVGHIEFSASLQEGIGFFNGNTQSAFGLGFDNNLNFALYGNFHLCFNFLNSGVQIERMKELFSSLSSLIDDYPREHMKIDRILGISLGIECSVNCDFGAENLTGLFGYGTTSSMDVNINGFDVSLKFNYDGDGNFLGFGLGGGLSINTPVSVAKITVLNRGIILNYKDFDKLFKSIQNFTLPNSPDFISWSLDRGILVLKCGDSIILNTDINASKVDDNLIISDKARKAILFNIDRFE